MYFHEIRVDHYHARHSFTRKFCGCMSLRGGCAIACAIWAGLHLYVSIMAFQQQNPIFSYLNKVALIVLGVICVLLVAVAFYDLFALFVESTRLLRMAHRITWITVVLFIVDFFVSIILFGIEKQQYENWCMGAYRDSPLSPSVFNCSKLWEDELKLAIAVFIVLCICYLYWATCLWSYAQKIITVGREAAKALSRGPPLPPQPMPPGTMPPGTMMPGMYNLKPTITVLEDGYAPKPEEPEEEDGEKSAAQIARILFKKIKDAWR